MTSNGITRIHELAQASASASARQWKWRQAGIPAAANDFITPIWLNCASGPSGAGRSDLAGSRSDCRVERSRRDGSQGGWYRAKPGAECMIRTDSRAYDCKEPLYIRQSVHFRDCESR